MTSDTWFTTPECGGARFASLMAFHRNADEPKEVWSAIVERRRALATGTRPNVAADRLRLALRDLCIEPEEVEWLVADSNADLSTWEYLDASDIDDYLARFGSRLRS